MRRVAWLYGSLLLGSLVLGFVSKIGSLADSPWPETCIAVLEALIVCGFVVNRRAVILPLLRLPQINALKLAKLTGITLGCCSILLGYFFLLQQMGVPTSDPTARFVAAGWPVWSMFVSVSLMPAVFEELAFRGVIGSSLEVVFSGVEAWLIQAALFSVLHLIPIIFPSHFVMGLLFGWLRMQTGSLYPGMVMHGLWNAMVVAESLH